MWIDLGEGKGHMRGVGSAVCYWLATNNDAPHLMDALIPRTTPHGCSLLMDTSIPEPVRPADPGEATIYFKE